MLIDFTKMHGLGNDFVVIDGRGGLLDGRDMESFSRRLCERRFGIGADQLLVLNDSARADFRMQIFNPDGGEVEMCGNGIRCLARYIAEEGLSGESELSVETPAGIIRPRLLGDEVEVDMGEPVLEGPRIPVNLPGRVIGQPLRVGEKDFLITCLSMGNPHCVVFVEDVASFPLGEYGPLLENHPLFPRRTNVEFVQVTGPESVRMRVWERGAGETMACGTGACAVATTAVLVRGMPRRLAVELPGGGLKILWSGEDNRVYMRGPAVSVYRGRIEI